MKPRRFLSGLWLGLVVGLAGCATTNETDAAKVKWGDLSGSGRERLQRHLEARRQVLAALQARAGELETQLLKQLGKLRQIEKARAVAAQNDAAARGELHALEAQRKKAEQTLAQIAATKAEIERSRAAAVQANEAAAAQARQQQQALQKDVQRLEAEVALIDDEVRRTLRLREEQALREREN